MRQELLAGHSLSAEGSNARKVPAGCCYPQQFNSWASPNPCSQWALLHPTQKWGFPPFVLDAKQVQTPEGSSAFAMLWISQQLLEDEPLPLCTEKAFFFTP